MSYLYTASKLATSTVQRKLASVTPPSVAAWHPFTIWTEDDLSPAVCYPAKTEYKTVWRSPNNRAARRFVRLAGETPVTV